MFRDNVYLVSHRPCGRTLMCATLLIKYISSSSSSYHNSVHQVLHAEQTLQLIMLSRIAAFSMVCKKLSVLDN